MAMPIRWLLRPQENKAPIPKQNISLKLGLNIYLTQITYPN
jgi:hypothetical protein